jgi:hypothetical protein
VRVSGIWRDSPARGVQMSAFTIRPRECSRAPIDSGFNEEDQCDFAAGHGTQTLLADGHFCCGDHADVRLAGIRSAAICVSVVGVGCMAISCGRSPCALPHLDSFAQLTQLSSNPISQASKPRFSTLISACAETAGPRTRTACLGAPVVGGDVHQIPVKHRALAPLPVAPEPTRCRGSGTQREKTSKKSCGNLTPATRTCGSATVNAPLHPRLPRSQPAV